MATELDRQTCDHCSGEMMVVSDWSADDEGRGWQRITRYRCRDCGREDVETVARDGIEIATDGGVDQPLTGTDRCSSCGRTSEETNLGFSETREELVCSRCVAFLGEHGHYPDEDGPERSVTVEYELQPEADQ